MYKIQGKITVKESGLGIPNLVVHAYDIDLLNKQAKSSSPEVQLENLFPYDSLGSLPTGEDGSFLLQFNKEDFSSITQEDPRPELHIIVTRPEDADENAQPNISSRALYISSPVRYKAGKIETFLIRIPEAQLEQYHLNPESAIKIINIKDAKIAKSKAIIDAQKKAELVVKAKVDEAFAGFTLSKQPAHILSSKNYLNPGDNLQQKQAEIFDEKLSAIASIADDEINKQITLSFSQVEMQALGLWTDGMPVAGTITKTKVLDLIKSNSLQRRTVKRCIKLFTESDLNEHNIVPAPGDVISPADVIDELTIAEQIQKQLSSSTSPETALKYEKVVDQNYKNTKICESINQFSLCAGPADVTAYHDFQSLEIAFEHVWTELFNSEEVESYKRLYGEFIKIDTGLRDVVYSTDFNTGVHHTVPLRTPDQHILAGIERQFSTIPYADDSMISKMIFDIEARLNEPHKFSIFAPNSINYGVMYTFRQKWEPVNYQVGKLISSLPLAPKEVRKYSTKRVVTKSKNEKYLDDREFKGKTDSSSTSRAESEIIKRAQQNTSFGMNSTVSIDLPVIDASITSSLSNTSEKFSQDTKKNFREAVLNASEEYRKQNKSEIEFGFKDEYTTETSGEISNPNDEITVTYLFYELQRQYDISEFLHKITPVILVANEVPTPAEIDVDWLLTNAWILKRIILDESFLPALQNLMDSPIGDTMALDNLKKVMQKQVAIVDSIQANANKKQEILNKLNTEIESIARKPDADMTAMDRFTLVRTIMDPIGSLLTKGASTEDKATQADRINEYIKNTVEKTEKENAILAASLKQEQSALQQIVEKYNKEMREFFDKQTAITQLKIHIKENILYYMQRIWDYEPPDQRFFRLYNLDVQWFENTTEEVIHITPRGRRHGGLHDYSGRVRHRITRSAVRKKLVQVADLDNILGYKGNYMIFPVKEISYLHAYMMQEFIDNATDGIKDADEFANYTTQDLIDYLKCVKLNNPATFEAEKNFVIALINERLTSTRKEKERIVIPTNSLFIEALPGKHPIMEDFKLAHRALDVKKVQAEVRHAELENLRLAARLIAGEREDPDIEKVVIKR